MVERERERLKNSRGQANDVAGKIERMPVKLPGRLLGPMRVAAGYSFGTEPAGGTVPYEAPTAGKKTFYMREKSPNSPVWHNGRRKIEKSVLPQAVTGPPGSPAA